MPKSLVVVASVLWLGVPAYAFDQEPGRQVFKPVAELIDETVPPAACGKCQPHVDRIKELQRLRRVAHGRLKYFQQRGVELSRAMANERDFVVGMGLTMEVGDLERAIDGYTTQIVQALKELADCNLSCGDRPPPGGTGTTGTSMTTTTAPIATTCPDCQRIIEDLQAAEARRKRDAEALEHYQREEQQKTDQHQANQNALRDLRRNNQGNSAAARKLEDDISFSEMERRSLGAEFDAEYIRALQQRVAAEESEIARLKQKLEDCQKYCQPKKTSGVFRSPLPYAVGGGAVALAALIGGGGESQTVTAGTPMTPQSPINATPPSQPAPNRRPAAVVTVSGCVCVDNSALFDAILQLCQRLRQIRTSGSGNTMTLTGDAPLPAFQGTFNESTGAFELTATTMVGNMTSTVVIAGTVETSGGFGNLRVSFGGANGRQTLYTLNAAPGQ